jgi:hypothetical protein
MVRVMNYILKNKIIELKNFTSLSSLPLFNDDFFIDYNGDIFLNNMFLYHDFRNYRNKILQGNILNIASLYDFTFDNIDYCKMILGSNFHKLKTENVIRSTFKVYTVFNRLIENYL